MTLTREQVTAIIHQLAEAPDDTLFAVWAGFEATSPQQLGGEGGRIVMISNIIMRLTPLANQRTHPGTITRLRNNGFKF